jgi:hypothetical protein
VKPSSVTFPWRLVEERAAQRPPGYLEAVLAAGSRHGDLITLDLKAYHDLCEKYSPRGVGDLIAKVAQPVARAIDAFLGTNIQNCDGCLDRQNKLNEILPFK